MCFRDISTTLRGSSPVQAGMSSSENESTCRARWWDWDTAGLDEDILSDTDESDALEALACVDGAQVSRKRSLQRTSLEKSEASGSSKQTRIAHGKSTVVDVSPAKRIEEFPNECLVVDSGKLVCTACRLELSKKRSIIVSHIETNCHQKGKAGLASATIRQQLVKETFVAYQKRQREQKELSGTGLTEAVPIAASLRRIEVVRSFLQA
eukprot:scpid29670/ scgid7509/ 